MNPHERVVTKIPLTELWDEEGVVSGERLRNLDDTSLTELLRAYTVQFVVADCGLKLSWLPVEQRFQFWKRVRFQIANPTKPFQLSEFPQETAYIASEWRTREGGCVVLLEKHH